MKPLPYPDNSADRSRWILNLRKDKNLISEDVPYSVICEEEIDENGISQSTLTVFLSNRECPFRCLMCDLWVNTLDYSVGPGAINRQIAAGISRFPAAVQIKLYNAGSFFDPAAIPPDDYSEIAAAIKKYGRVIVESHPSFINERCLNFSRLIDGQLEVAIGLETADEQTLDKLNKKFNVQDFKQSADLLLQNGIDLRVFILVRPPFTTEKEGLEQAKRSLDFAFECGAEVCCLIPTRAGNGAMDALADSGFFAAPSLRSVETAMEYGLSSRQNMKVTKRRVFADLWDIERFYDCVCSPRRAARLALMNSSQIIPAPIECGLCPSIYHEKIYDIAVVGSGFGGSLISMIARRIGLSVILLERGAHPRFAIGESTSPLMNLIIEQLALKYDLPNLLPLTTYGSWQKSVPEIACGLKRGFTYYHHTSGARYISKPDRSNQLMVAASPRDDIGDTHWFRSDIDHFLMQEALDIGVDYLDHMELNEFITVDDQAVLKGNHRGDPITIQARFVIDASGPGGFLARAQHIPQGKFDNYPATQSLYSHFQGVKRCDSLADFQNDSIPPYPPDDAALHHVFDGGWMWVLRFNNGITSAGVAMQDWLAQELNLSEGEPAWYRFLNRFPSIAAQFEDASVVRPFVYAGRLAYKAEKITGENWALLPSAAAFIDPLFSTGMPLTLLGIERLGCILQKSWGMPEFQERLLEYGQTTVEEADYTAQFISACYAGMKQFPLFAAFSMFYFTAASFAEISRRIESRPRYTRYLAADSNYFSNGFKHSARQMHALAASKTVTNLQDFEKMIFENTDPLNIAGLCDPSKNGWYGVRLEDVINSSGKLGLTENEMRNILSTASWV